MANRTELQERIDFRRASLKAARSAYLALLQGQVQSYAIGSRNLTKFDLPKLKEEIDELEKEIDSLENSLSNGGKRRKAFAVVARDW